MSIHQLLEHFFSWISSYPASTVLIVCVSVLFIASLLESLPFAGMFFPSESLTIFFGVLAFKGVVDIKILIIATYLGILAGDILGYYIGKKVGEDFLRKHTKKLKIDNTKYETIKNGLKNNLIKILFIGRTNGFTRWIAPFLARAHHINFKKFIFANMLTAAFWAPAFLLGGYFLGNAFELYGKYLGVGILTATVMSYIIYKIYKYLEKKDLLQREDFRLLLIAIFGLYLFSKMLEDVLDLELVTQLDNWISIHIHELYTPIFTKIMVAVTSVDNPLQMGIIVAILSIYLIYKKYYARLSFLLLAFFSSSVVMFFVKELVHRQRPKLHIIDVAGYSFPSGHATVSTAISFSLYIIFREKVKYKKLLLFLCIMFPLIISFSRVYLNVHYFSDVMAGIGLSLFCVSVLALIFDAIKGKYETKIFNK